MLTLAQLSQWLTIFAGIVAFTSAIYVARNKALLENYKATVESQERRISDQQRTIVELTERVTHLEGQRDGYKLAAELYMNAVAEAGVCGKAWECEDRRVPHPRTGRGL